METKFNFSSQICTTREQSERLLALGLKKETADCYYWQETEPMYGEAAGIWHLENLVSKDNQEHFEYLDKNFGVCLADDEEHYFIPAWSLHRLLCFLPKYIQVPDNVWEYKHDLYLSIDEELNVRYEENVYEPCFDKTFWSGNIYQNCISCIKWLIKEGYFNKEYLEE